MSKVLFAISLMGLMACGTGESDPGATGSAADKPAVSAAKAPATEAAKEAAVKQAPAEAGQNQANYSAAIVRSCLDLVTSGEYQNAVPVCLEATSIDAKNAEVQAALAKAQSETAAKAASGAATDAAAKALGGISN